jgi:release factor glutamine methyltransferase
VAEAWTIKKVLDFADDYFRKAGIESPHLEAEILLAHALNLKRIDLYIKFESALAPEELKKFKGYIVRRKDHEPTAYIIESKAFMSLDLRVTKDVLIPRPESEALVEEAIRLSNDIEGGVDILDIGTGSGALAVSIAKYVGKARVVATDISQKAIEVAVNNAEKLGVSDRIRFETADLYPSGEQKFDIIVSNPPYILYGAISGLAPEVKDHEPRIALDGGEDGLDQYRRIISGASEKLKEKGMLILEIDPPVTEGVKALAKASGFSGVEIRKDLNSLERTAVIYRR